MVKNQPAIQETQETCVRSLGQEDPLEKGMASHSSILAWRIPWTEKPGVLQSTGSQKSDTTEQLNNNNVYGGAGRISDTLFSFALKLKLL